MKSHEMENEEGKEEEIESGSRRVDIPMKLVAVRRKITGNNNSDNY